MSLFFGKNSPAWTDMSDYVVHFARNYGGRPLTSNMLSILGSRVITARNPFGLEGKGAETYDAARGVLQRNPPPLDQPLGQRVV
jgi:hypothetical protein